MFRWKMLLKLLFAPLFRSKNKTFARRKSKARVWIEQLEERTVPTQNVISIGGSVGSLTYTPTGQSAQSGTYTQNFSTLPASTLAVTANSPATGGPIDLSSATSNNFGTDASLAGWYTYNLANATKDNFAEGLGAATTGSLYDFNDAAAPPAGGPFFALGTVSTPTTTNSRFGAIFYNNTSGNLNQFSLSYTGEEWWQNTGGANTLDFGYEVETSNPTLPTSGTGTQVAGLAYTVSAAGQAAGASEDGGAAGAAYSATINNSGAAVNIAGTPWAAGDYLVIFWDKGTSPASKSPGLGVANLTFSANYVATGPSITSASNVTAYAGIAPGSLQVTTTSTGTPTFAVSPALPTWASLNTSTGLITFTTPPAVTTTTTTSYSLTATDSTGAGFPQTFTLTELPTIAYTTALPTQTFSTLPATPQAAVGYGTGTGPFDLSASAIFGGTSTDTGLSGWYAQNIGSASSATKTAVGEATATTGALYAFNDADIGGTSVALGTVGTTSVAASFGEILVNQTSQTLNTLSLSYTGEEWRQGGTADTTPLSFFYQVGSTSMASYEVGGTVTGSATYVAGLSFTPPNQSDYDAATGSDGFAEDGGATLNQSSVSGTAGGFSWAPGQIMVIYWNKGQGVGGGNGLGVSNVSFTASYTATPAITSNASTSVYAGVTPPTFQVTASPAATSYSLTYTGTVGTAPTWVSFNTSTGLITFTSPPAVATTTPYTYSIVATNGAGSSTPQTFTLTELPTVAYGTAGSAATQTFSGLPTASALATTSSGTNVGPFDLTGAFPAGFGSSDGLAGWYAQNIGGSPPSGMKMAEGTATASTGALYDFNGSLGNALGTISTTSVASAFGEILVNTTAQTLNSFTLSYTGEVWYQNAATSMNFSYQIGSTSLTGGTVVAGLGFADPNSGSGGVAVDGSTSPYQTATPVSDTIYGISWAPGQPLVLEWNKGTGASSSDGLAIANVSFTASNVVTPGITSAATDSVYAGVSGQTFQITATNSPIISYSLTGASVPSWVSLNTATGLITFTSPTAVATTTTYPLSISATNASGAGTPQTFTLTEMPTVAYTSTGAASAQDFSGLAAASAAPVGTSNGGGAGPYDLTGTFPNGFGSSDGLAGWYAEDIASGVNTEQMGEGQAGGTGAKTGSLYDFSGLNGNALGTISTTADASRFGEIFVNQTATTLTSFTLSYTGEVWWQSAATSMNFGYLVGGTSLATTNGGTNVASLGFSDPNVGSALTTFVDGSTSTYQTASAVSGTVNNISWAPGQPLLIYWDKGTGAGSSDGLGISNVSFTASGNAASQLAFTTTPQTLTAGVLSATMTVQEENSSGIPTMSAETINLASSNTGTGVFENTSGTTITSISIASGSSSASFTYVDTLASTPTLTAQASGLTSATQSETVLAAGVAKLAFTTAAPTLTAGVLSGAITVQEEDQYGNATTAAETVNLSSSNSSTGVFENTSGTTISSLSIASGSSTASFNYEDTLASTPTLTAQASGLTSATQSETVVAAAAKLVFTSTAQTLTAGVLSGTMTVQEQDQYGNVSTMAETINLSSGNTGTGVFENTSGTTITSISIASGSSTASFKYEDTLVSTPTLTAQAIGLTSATQGETVLVAAVAKLVFTSTAPTLTAGVLSGTMTVQEQDQYGNVTTAAETINLSSNNSSTGVFENTSGTTITSISIASGSSTASFTYEDSLASTPTLTAQASGLTSATQSETVLATAAAKLVFTTTAQTLTAGVVSSTITVQEEDQYGNASTTAETVSLSSSNSGTGVFANTSGTTITSISIASGSSTASFTYEDTLVSTPTLTAQGGGLTSATQSETVLAGAAAKLVFTNTAQTLTAGGLPGTMTVQEEDQYGNVTTTAETVNLSSSNTSTGIFASPLGASITSVSIASGSSTGSFVYLDTLASAPTLTAQAGGLTAATQGEMVLAAAAAKLVFTTTAPTLTAGVLSGAMTVQEEDHYGNPTTTIETVNLSSSNTTSGVFENAAGTSTITSISIASGSSTASFKYEDTLASTPTLTAQASGLTSATQSETVLAGAVAKLVFTSTAQTLTAGVLSGTMTVQEQDQYGNVTSTAETVNLSSSNSGTSVFENAAGTSTITSVSIASGSSTASFKYEDTLASTPTLTAQAGGLTSATQSETVLAGAVANLVFTNTAQTLTAGVLSGTMTVQEQDQYGNVTTAAETVNLSSSSTTSGVFENAAGTSTITSVSIASGSSTASFKYEDTLASTPTLTAQAGALTSATQSETVLAGAVAKLVFTSTAQTLTAGVLSGTITVQEQDQYGNVTSTAETINLSSSNSGTSVFQNTSGTTITSVSIASGSSTASFKYEDTLASTPTLTAQAGGLTSATQSETVLAGAVAKLVFTSTAQTLTAGVLSGTMTVQEQDQYGNVTSTAESINLSSSNSGTSVFENAAGTSTITSVSIASGSSTASFKYADTLASTPTLTAQAGGLTSATQSETVLAGAAAKLVFTSTAQTLTAGVLSGTMTVQEQDQYGNVTTAAETINLSSSNTTSGVFENAAGTSTITSVSIASGSSTASFKYEDTLASTPTLTAQAGALTSATQSETVLAAGVAKLVFTSTAQTLTAGVLSGTMTVQEQDQYGNVTSTAETVNLSSSNSGTSVFQNTSGTTITSVSIASGSSTASFKYADTLASTPTLTAQAGGLTSATQSETVLAASVAKLVFTTTAQTLTAGVLSGTMTVQEQDQYGNVTSTAESINLSSSNSGTSVFENAAGTSTITSVSIASGSSTASFKYEDTLASTPTLTAQAGGLTSATQSETVLAGAAAKLVFTSTAQTLTAGVLLGTMTVQEQDQYGNVTTAAETINLSSSNTTSGVFENAAGTSTITSVSIASGNSTASFKYEDTLAGTPTLTAQAGGLTSATQSETVLAASVAKLVFTSTAQTLTAGVLSGTMTVQEQDQYGNVTSTAETVNLSSSNSGTSVFENAAGTSTITSVSIASGGSTASFKYEDTLASTPTLTAQAGGLTSATQSETVLAAGVAKLVFTSTAQTLTAGVLSGTMTVQEQDQYGNVTSTAETVNLSSSNSGTSVFENAAGTSTITSVSIASGSSTASFKYADTLASTPTLTAQASGLTSATQSETVLAGAAAKLVFTSTAQTLTAGVLSGTMIVQEQDQYGNVTSTAETINLSSSNSGTSVFQNTSGTTITSVSIASGSSTASFKYEDTLASTPTLTAQAGGLTSATQSETVLAASVAKLVFTSTAQTLTAGVLSGTMTVQEQDQYGNVTSTAETVNLSSSNSGTSVFENAAGTSTITSVSIASGSSTASFKYADTLASTPTLTAQASGLTSATQSETVLAGAAAKLVFTSTAQTLTAGVLSGTMTVQEQDQYGNVTSAAESINLSSSNSGTSVFENAAGTSTITSVSIASGSSTASFKYEDTLASTPTLTAQAGGLTSATQSETVLAAGVAKLVFTSTAQTLTAGALSGTMTVQEQDQYGNVTSTAESINLSSSNSGTSVFENAAGTSTITSVSIASGNSTASFKYADTLASTPTLTAQAGGLTSATQSETVLAASVAKLVFTSTAQTLTAGVLSGTMTVQEQDQYGNVTSTAETVNLSSSNSGTSVFENAAGTSTITSVSIASGSSTASFKYADTLASTPTLTAQASGLTSATQSETLLAAGVAKLVFTSTAQTLTAGVTSGTITVQLEDAYNNVATATSAQTVNLTTSSTAPSGAHFRDTGNATNITSVSIASGVSSASFTYNDTLASSPVLTVADSLLTSATQGETVIAAAASQFAVSAPTLATAGSGFSVTVTALDQFGNVATGYGGTVHFTSTDTNTQTHLPTDAGLRNGSGSFGVTLTKAGNQTITATDTFSSGITGSSGTIAVSAVSVSQFLVSAPAAVGSGTPFSFTVTAADEYGNTVSNYGGTVHFSSSDSKAVLPNNTTLIGGTGSFSATFLTTGSQTLTATDNVNSSITGFSSIEVAGTVTHFVVSATASTTAGTKFFFTVTAQDISNRTAVNYTGTIQITSTDPLAVLPQGSISLTGGVGTFAATLETAGSQTLTATDTVTSALSGFASIDVSPSSATHFAVNVPPSATAGTPFAAMVIAEDAYGNTATSFNNAVYLTSSDGQAVLPVDSSLSDGTGTFSITLKTAGNQTLTATDTANSGLYLTSGNITVQAGVATHFLVSAPSNPTAGVGFNFTLTAFDADNNVATGYAGIVHFTSSDSRAVLPNDAQLASGVGTFSATLKTAGFQSLTVTDDANSSTTGTDGNFSVSAATVSHFVFGSMAPAIVGSAFAFTLTAEDSFSNAVSDYTGTVHFTSSDPQAVLPANTTLSNGVGNFSATLKSIGAGTQTLTAADTVNAATTSTSNPITVTGSVSQFVFSAIGTVTAGSSFGFTVTAEDQFGDQVSAYNGSVDFTSSDAAAILPNNGTPNNGTLVGGSGAFTATLETAGIQNLVATGDTSNGFISGSTNATVDAGAATHFGFTSPSGATAGESFTVTVSALDKYDNVVPGFNGIVHFSSSDTNLQTSLPADSALESGVGSFPVTLTQAGTQTLAVSDTAASLTASNSIDVSAGAASKFLISATPTGSIMAGTPFNFTVTALDADNNVASGYSGTVHFTGTDTKAQTQLPANSTLTDGSGTFSATLTTAGTQTISVADALNGVIAGSSSNITVTPVTDNGVPVVTSLEVSGPSNAKAGAIALTVTACDKYGNAEGGYKGTIHFSSSDASASLPADYTFTPNDDGAHPFSVTLNAIGGQTVTVADASGGLSTTKSIVISGPATHFLVSAPTNSAKAGVPFTFTVTALDANNNVAGSYNGTVQFSSTDSGATLPSDASLINGTATFTALFAKPGNQTLTAADTVASGTLSKSMNITVSAGAATHFLVSAPSKTTAGTAFSVTLTAKDVDNNTAVGFSGPVQFSSSGAAILPTSNTTWINGVGTFHLTLKTAGAQTWTVGDNAASPTVAATVNNITVSPAAAALFKVAAPTSATAGSAFSVTVTAFDIYGNQATGYRGAIHLSSSDAGAVLPGKYTFTATDAGAHTFSNLVTLKTAGSETITATGTGSITGTSGAVNVAAAAATHFVVSGWNNATAGDPFTFTVTAEDAYNNTASGYAGTVHISSTDPLASLPANAVLTDGVGTFSVTFGTKGSQTLAAVDTVTKSIAGHSSAIAVTPGATTQFRVVAAPAVATAGSAVKITVTAEDAYGNTTTGYNGMVHFTSTDLAATLHANASLTDGVGSFSVVLRTSGSQTVVASDTVNNAITGTSNAVAVSTAAVAYNIQLSSGTAGAPLTFTVTAQDASGNTATGYTGTAHFTSSDPRAIFAANNVKLTDGVGTFKVTLKTAGPQSITATDSANGSITGTNSALTVNAAVASKFVISGEPSTAGAGSAFNFTVTAEDAFGNTATGYTGTVHFTSTDKNARTILPPNTTLTNGTAAFSATLTKAGPQTLTAVDSANKAIASVSSAIQVTADVPVALLVSDPVNSAAGMAITIVVTALDQFGNVATNYDGAVQITSSDPHAVLPTNPSLSGGTGTFKVYLKTDGNQTISVTDSGLSPPIETTIAIQIEAGKHS